MCDHCDYHTQIVGCYLNILVVCRSPINRRISPLYIKGNDGRVDALARFAIVIIAVAVVSNRLNLFAVTLSFKLCDLGRLCHSQQLCIGRCWLWIYNAVISDKIFAVTVANELVKIIVTYDDIALFKQLSNLLFAVLYS